MTTTAPAVDERRLMEFVFKAVGDFGALLDRLHGRDRRQARALPRPGRRRSVDGGRAGRPDRHDGAIRPRMAVCPGRRRVRDRRRRGSLHPAARARDRVDRRVEPGLRRRWVRADAGRGPLYRPAGRGDSGRATGSAGTSTTPTCSRACERFFRPGYAANLVSTWIPALDGVEAQLKAGARVADVGCGHGASVVVMAQAYPNSTVHGLRLPRRRRSRRPASGPPRPESRIAASSTVASRHGPSPGTYDLICFFDCLHDMGDPVGARAYALRAPRARRHGAARRAHGPRRSRDEQPRTRSPRLLHASTLLCTPNSLSQEVGSALGAQAGEARLREVFDEAGYTHFRRAAETPLNMILEARP